jgi:hypothetical protein
MARSTRVGQLLLFVVATTFAAETPNVTYLPMIPAPHGKPGMVSIGDTLIAFADLRLRRSTDGGRSFGPVINVIPDRKKVKLALDVTSKVILTPPYIFE